MIIGPHIFLILLGLCFDNLSLEVNPAAEISEILELEFRHGKVMDKLILTCNYAFKTYLCAHFNHNLKLACKS
jgi:hypothetical protein